MTVQYLGDFAEDATILIPFNTFDSNDPTASATITNLVAADIKVHKDGGLTQIVTDGATVVIDFDSITGNHMITVDTSVHADYSTGSDYAVRIEGTTVDAGTINGWLASFSIQNRYNGVNVIQLGGVTQSLTDLKDFADAGYDPATNKVQGVVLTDTLTTYTGNTPQTADHTAGIADIPTVAEFNARTLLAASYFDPAADTVVNVTNVAALTGHTAQTGDSFAKFAGITILANWLRAFARKDTADSTALTEINTGGGAYDEAVDSQESIADSVSATAPLAFNPDASSTIVTGSLISGTFADTATNNAVYWVVDDAGTGIEVITEMNLGSGRSGTSFLVNANFSSGAGRVVEFWAFNYTTAAYVKFSAGTAATEIRNSVSDSDYTFSLSASFTNPAAVIGEIKIKFLSAQSNATDRLSIDLVEVTGEASGVTSPDAIADAVANSEWGTSMNHIPKFAGHVHYVNGVIGDDTNSGLFPDSAFATIGAAIAAATAGDFIKVFATTYVEAIDLNLNGLELHGEIGATITGAAGVPLTVSADSCIIDNVLLTPAAGQKGLVITGDNNRTTLTDINDGLVSVEVSGTGNTFADTNATDYSQTGFDIQNTGTIMHICTAKTVNAGTRGFYLSNTLADRSILGTCESVNNTTAGFEIVTGVTNASFFGCAESETCGARVDNGTSTSWRQHSTTDEFLDITNNVGLPTSGSLSEDLQINRDYIELLRSHHSTVGNTWYVDPANGNDTTGDGSKLLPYATVTKAHTSAVDNNHDLIILNPGASGGLTTLTEQVTISKNYVFIRGPGRDFLWNYGAAGDVITVTGTGVEISGFRIETHTAGSGRGIACTGDFLLASNLYSEYTRGAAIYLENSDECIIDNVRFINVGQSGAGDAIEINVTGGSSALRNTIRNSEIFDSAGDGISLTIAAGTLTDTIIEGNYLHGAAAYGINIDTGVTDTVVRNNLLAGNTSGDILDNGTTTHQENNEQWAKHSIATEARLVKNDSLTFTVAGDLDVNVQSVGDSTVTGAAFNRAVKSNVIGTVGTGSTTTSIVTSSITPSGTATDQFAPRYLVFADDTTTSALRGQATDITANTAAANPTFTVTALTSSPVSGDTFVIL